MDATNKIVLITGAGKGIGKYLSEYYVEQGHTVIGCSRSESTIQHERYHHFCGDVADEHFAKTTTSSVAKQFGRIDWLLNNAGIASMNHAMLTPGSTLERVMNTNVHGTFLFSREAARIMSRKKFGRIVNFTTVAVPLRLEGEAIYAASKAAVESLTRILAKEFAPWNVTVNAIGPCPIKTDLIKNVGDEKLNKLLQQQAIHQYGELADVSNVTDFYLSEHSSMITGQVLYLGGVF
ncbi:MAG: SDR family NAD(P)-dependent oxidoreductase [Candidatus Kapaibacterium sp.]